MREPPAWAWTRSLADGALRLKDRIVEGTHGGPSSFRRALAAVPHRDQDAWVDLVLGLKDVPPDEPLLPPGCVPYLPCPVGAVVEAVSAAQVTEDDVFVDIGSGTGRVLALVHLLTGARTVGVEIQPSLAATSRNLASALGLAHVSTVEGDAAQLPPALAMASVVFLYCPFSGGRLERVLDHLAPLPRVHPVRICCVDLPLPPRPWLELVATPSGAVAVHRTRPGA